jgi:hypothetical protein
MQDSGKQEDHPLFPSGEWEGFYTYAMGSQADQHKMHFLLSFKDNRVSGSGADDVGSFYWEGSYSKERMDCVLTKYYPTHSVFYKGQVDENGIWGTWEIDFYTGGFHIWPKAQEEKQQAAALAIQEESNVGEGLFTLPEKQE